MSDAPTALLADDEPLLLQSLARQLHIAWPALRIVAQARHGREAVDMVEQHCPDICFLDVHMPGMSGVEAAQWIGRRAHLVFVTAYQQYAVQAFEQGALDYLVKPVEAPRLADTVARLQQRLRLAEPIAASDALLDALAARLEQRARPAGLRWLRASSGSTVRLIAVDEVDYLRAEDKYTLIAWRAADGTAAEAVIRTPLKELLAQLDPTQFAQTHRAVVVNLRAISHLVRADNDTAQIHLRSRPERLPVSRSFLPQFRQM
ncbi:MAG: LytR/AlgR family response regulator transcription factor [Pseudomarimonas sp.]